MAVLPKKETTPTKHYFERKKIVGLIRNKLGRALYFGRIFATTLPTYAQVGQQENLYGRLIPLLTLISTTHDKSNI